MLEDSITGAIDIHTGSSVAWLQEGGLILQNVDKVLASLTPGSLPGLFNVQRIHNVP